MDEIRDQFGTDAIHIALDGRELDPSGWPGLTQSRNMGRYWELRCEGNPQDILRLAMQQGPIKQFAIIHPTLQDIFVRLARPNPEEMRHE
ncbi:MAG: DUF4162 domain-containing protein [Verrucomicrobia bacterium]|nr:DUF4162 domain-containing protein [Verrucomicrobiota bacterium]